MSFGVIADAARLAARQGAIVEPEEPPVAEVIPLGQGRTPRRRPRPARPAAGVMTVGQAIDAFIAGYDPKKQRGTRKEYGKLMDRFATQFDGGTPLASLSDEAVREWVTTTWADASPRRWNWVLMVLRTAYARWRKNGWTEADPLSPLGNKKVTKDTTRCLSRGEVDRLLNRPGTGLRDRLLWRMLYESLARIEEVLSLDVQDLNLAGHYATVVRKGGRVDRISWQSGTAGMLTQYLKGRTTGPLFLTGARAQSHLGLSPADIDPVTGRARLSYRQAAKTFQAVMGRRGATLHWLRHSGATHKVDDGIPLPVVQQIGGWESPDTMTRNYLHPSDETAMRWQQRTDPGRRKK